MLRFISLVLVAAICSAGPGCVALGQPQPEVHNAAVADDPAALKGAGIASINEREENAARFEQFGKERRQAEVKPAEPPGLGDKLVQELVMVPLLYTFGFIYMVTGNGVSI